MSGYAYPGVYIQELPSAVHTITGVATSIAAFNRLDRPRANNEAVLVQSHPEFSNQFGPLDSRTMLGYAVNQFFANGGSQAYIIRLAWTDAKTASASGGVGGPLI